MLPMKEVSGPCFTDGALRIALTLDQVTNQMDPNCYCIDIIHIGSVNLIFVLFSFTNK